MAMRGCSRPAWLLACCTVLALLGRLPAAAAAAPADELLRLVPEDVGFCLIVQDLREHATSLLPSPFAQQFRKSPLGTALANAPEIAKLEAVEKYLRQHLSVDWPRLRDDVLGDAVVFAYRPGPPGKVDKDEQGLMLLRARDARLLADLVERLNRLQKESGDVKEIETREHHGVKYYRRVERRQDGYYYLNGPVLAFSSQEAMLRRAIDLERKAPAGAEPSVARELRLLGVDRRLATLWINPRAFDPELELKAAGAAGDEAVVLKKFLTYWQALDGVAVSLAVRKDIELSLAVRARTEQLPATARRFFAGTAQRSELWDRFPENALLAVAGRVDAAALVEMVGDFLPPQASQAARTALDTTLGAALDRNLTREVLPCLGPDVGFCVTAPSAADKGWFPHMVLAMRVRPGEDGKPVDQALLSAVNFFAMSAVLGHNASQPDPMKLKSVMQDKVEVKYLVNDRRFPPGFQPAFALQGGYLVLASSPEAVRRFGAAAPAGLPSSGEVPLLRLSVAELRRFLLERREPLAAATAAKDNLTRDEALRRLDDYLTGLQLVDRVDLVQRPGIGQMVLMLRVQTAQPLR